VVSLTVCSTASFFSLTVSSSIAPSLLESVFSWRLDAFGRQPRKVVKTKKTYISLAFPSVLKFMNSFQSHIISWSSQEF
jgi:hypothetical protein